tara:strand:+ start:23 stop:343 length:321 start_codon:yes stop_codon:yes gene_type:complete
MTSNNIITTVTIKPTSPEDSEVNQLNDVGKQVIKYIHSKVHAHPKSTNGKSYALYKEALMGHKLVVVLPDKSEANSSETCRIIELRGYIRNIVNTAKNHDIDIQIQ